MHGRQITLAIAGGDGHQLDSELSLSAPRRHQQQRCIIRQLMRVPPGYLCLIGFGKRSA
jgi:hypothetical protein